MADDKVVKVKDNKKVEAGKKSGITRALKARLRKAIKEGDISGTALQEATMNNWIELLEDKDKQVRAFATEKISKYIFAPKQESNKYPDININVSFVGIKEKK